jgi:hypothetical protein
VLEKTHFQAIKIGLRIARAIKKNSRLRFSRFECTYICLFPLRACQRRASIEGPFFWVDGSQRQNSPTKVDPFTSKRGPTELAISNHSVEGGARWPVHPITWQPRLYQYLFVLSGKGQLIGVAFELEECISQGHLFSLGLAILFIPCCFLVLAFNGCDVSPWQGRFAAAARSAQAKEHHQLMSSRWPESSVREALDCRVSARVYLLHKTPTIPALQRSSPRRTILPSRYAPKA